MFCQRPSKLTKLFFCRYISPTDIPKVKLPIKMLLNQESLTYTPTPIDNNQFGAIGVKTSVKLLSLVNATDKI